jgi:TPR repeat protein
MYKNGQGVPRDSGMAYFWFNVAAATTDNGEDQKKISEERDAIAVTLTPQQLAEAQRLAREWWTKGRESAS